MRPPFSSRLHWDLRPNRLAQALDAKRRAGAKVLDLTESNPTRAGLAYPSDEILAAFADARSLVYEPKPAGLQAARDAVARYYAARGQAVEPSRILLTSSTSESYAWLFKLLADPGDEVLVPRPSYPLFEFLAQMESVRVTHYPLIYHDGWSIDTEALAGAVSDRTRAIVLVNPNNPTGSFVKRCDLDVLVPLCTEQGIALISDEVFADYAFGPDAERVPSLAHLDGALAFCLSGLSKIAGLPQMKLGWIIIGGPPVQRCRSHRTARTDRRHVSFRRNSRAARATEVARGGRECAAANCRSRARKPAVLERRDRRSFACADLTSGGWVVCDPARSAHEV